jgi:hypothetical protein
MGMTGLLGFVFYAVGVSLSGVMAPGPLATSTLAAGMQRRHAGAWIAVGHAIVEIPLMLLIVKMLSLKGLLESTTFRIDMGTPPVLFAVYSINSDFHPIPLSSRRTSAPPKDLPRVADINYKVA